MKQSLQLKLGQQLTMTPQLQQAIRLLQLSSMELELEVQQALDSNMMLELEEEEARESFDFNSEGAAPGNPGDSSDYEGGEAEFGGGEEEFSVPSAAEDIPENLPVDSDWDEIFDNTLAATGPSNPHDDASGEFDNVRSSGGSLREHLLWQVNLLQLTAADRAVAVAIVDAINEDGYLDATLEEIRDAVNADESLDDALELDEIAAVLKLVQALEPAGVGARDLKECLLLQFRQLPADTPLLALAQRVTEEYLDALGAREYAMIMRRLKVDQETLKQAISLIQSLNPRPGSQYGDQPAEYLVPDVFVRKSRGRWKVELNPDSVPHVRINPYYASMVRRADNSPGNSSLKAHLQEAKWFIKSLQSRSETLLKVATAIVERQKAFLDYGDEAMKPLVLHDIAEALGMHESTISRVTSRKYMHTPRGIYELKYFFSSHVSTSMGGEASSTAIRAVIKKLIAAEHTDKPLSDSKIANILSKQGINVARRTVAKYREAMQIPPSNERKRLA
jgi:RNA polymerase sigma-54 factor